MRKLPAVVAGALALATIAGPLPHQLAWSQGRTIRIILPVPAGGSIDHMSRILADHLSAAKGQSIVIEPRPGAGGIIAAEAVARASADGNTILVSNNGILINSILRKVNYDALASFE